MTSRLFLVSFLASSLAFAQQPAAPPAGHDAHAVEIPGLKKELFAGITEADFLKLGDKPKTVKITLVATFSAANYGMNFNGYSHGRAIFTVPKDWTVEVTFINPSPIPHSAVVVEKDTTKKLQMGEAYFDGAGVPKPEVGLSLTKAEFSFVADETGEFALACGFPAHAINGHWLALNISDTAKAPTLQLGDKPAMEAK
ncbi:MAG: sulfocyanin-like copper-binding protein [Rhodoferax sp.]|uniref:sulfocyanin-like copper-binding protein n=1 Tax=Rhodoferax sp. TaxID=50421 RepID=UPI00272F44D9|nr:sulfocyanin-like copper-binding protein [Rhodoferax sp.]MDP1528837.1 sulfocyanin-like copper-binding protein [Rhodoferax sp.]